MNDPQGFQNYSRQEIPQRDPLDRRQDWKDIQSSFSSSFLKEQSRRCMDCGVAFCQGDTGCPVRNLIPEWNSLVSQDQWKKAYLRLQSTNNFPEFTGRLCPAPCESACVLEVHSQAVNIKAIEQSIIERAFEEGWVTPQKSPHPTYRKVAVIGSGPAGLAAAQQLARMGHQVVVFEKENQIGGLLRFGIPDFKLPKELVDRRLAQLEAEGVVFQTSTTFGKDFFFEDVMSKFDALALAIGAEEARELPVPGRNLEGIHLAMDYLTQQNRALGPEATPVKISANGKKVIILGGGDTGSDCLGTALRQGASQVLQFEILPKPPLKRSSQSPWPFWPMKLKTSHAHEEGGERHWNLATSSFQGLNGRVSSLIAQKVQWQDGQMRESSRKNLVFDADLVLLALGFTGARKEYLNSIPGLRFSSQGQIQTDGNFRTDSPGVFACGDARRGASLIVWAISEGRQMAESIHRYLLNAMEINTYPPRI